MLNLVRPEFFMPLHGEYRMLVQHGRLAVQTGVEAENVFVVENGDVLEFTREYGDKIGKTYGGNVLVDGSGIGDIGEAVLRDRKALSNDGIVIVVVAIDAEEARVIGEPDLISKGVFYLPESEGVLDELRTELRNAIAEVSVEAIRDVNTVKEHIRTTLARAINRANQTPARHNSGRDGGLARDRHRAEPACRPDLRGGGLLWRPSDATRQHVRGRRALASRWFCPAPCRPAVHAGASGSERLFIRRPRRRWRRVGRGAAVSRALNWENGRRFADHRSFSGRHSADLWNDTRRPARARANDRPCPRAYRNCHDIALV